MFPRVGGAVLALAAAALFAVSTLGLPWWSGHPDVDGKTMRIKTIDVGPLGASGCNTDGKCTAYTLTSRFKIAGLGEAGATGLVSLGLLALALVTLSRSERRKGIGRFVLFGVIVIGAGGAIVLIFGPGIKTDGQTLTLPKAPGLALFWSAVATSIAAALVTAREIPRKLFIPKSAPPLPPFDVQALTAPEPMPPPPYPQPMQPQQNPEPMRPLAQSPGGALPGFAGLLGGGGAQPSQYTNELPPNFKEPASVSNPLPLPWAQEASYSNPQEQPSYRNPAEQPSSSNPFASTPSAPRLNLPPLMRPTPASIPVAPPPISRPKPASIAPTFTPPGIPPKRRSGTSETAPPPFSALGPPKPSVPVRPTPLPRPIPATVPPPQRQSAVRPAVPPIPSFILPMRVETGDGELAETRLRNKEEPEVEERSTNPRDEATDPSGYAIGEHTSPSVEVGEAAEEHTVDGPPPITPPASDDDELQTRAREKLNPTELETMMESALPAPGSPAPAVPFKVPMPARPPMPTPAPTLIPVPAPVAVAVVVAPLAPFGAPLVAPPVTPPAAEKIPISTAPQSLPPPTKVKQQTSGPSPACPQCESPMAWVDEHLRFYCKSCRMYF